MSYYTDRLADIRAEIAFKQLQRENAPKPDQVCGEEHPRHKLTAHQVRLARALRNEKNMGWRQIQRVLGVDVASNTIQKAVEGKTWKSII